MVQWPGSAGECSEPAISAGFSPIFPEHGAGDRMHLDISYWFNCLISSDKVGRPVGMSAGLSYIVNGIIEEIRGKMKCTGWQACRKCQVGHLTSAM